MKSRILNKRVWTRVFLAVTVAPALALAQGVEEMLVFGQQLEETIPQELARYGNRLEVIDAAQIELGGYNDLAQTLQMEVPGLYIAPKHGAFDYMNCSLQGSRCEDILWLVDGVRINNRLYNGTSPLDTIPAHMIERIEVLYGGQGIFYGTQSVAGVVNVVTKSARNTMGGSVSLGGDGNDGEHINGTFGLGSDSQQFAIYASRDEADGFQPIPTADFQPSGTHRERGYEVETAGIKYALNPGDLWSLSLHYHHTDAFVENLRPWKQAYAFNDRDEDLITAKLDVALSDRTDFYLKAYYHDWDTVWTRIENEVVGGQVTGSTVTIFEDAFWGYEDYGATVVGRTETEHGLIYSAGFDHQRYRGSDDVWLIADKTESVNAGFFQVGTAESLFENTRLALGVRHNQAEESEKTVWNLSGQHNFSEMLYLRGSVGTAFRLPDAEELYLMDCCEVGNPNLEPEESFNFNLAFGGTAAVLEGLSWELSGFSRRIDNLIDIDFDNPGYPDGIFENFDTEVELDGYQIDLGLALTESLHTSASYVQTDATFEGSSQQLTDIPEETLKWTLQFLPADLPVEADISLVHVGNVWDQVSGVGRLEHGDYTVVDFGGAFYFGEMRQHRLGVRVENVTDEEYVTSLGSARRDVDNSRYAYRNLGTPRTLHATYTFTF